METGRQTHKRGSTAFLILAPLFKKVIHEKIAMEYLETYRHTCEYFYLAAKRFSRNTLELADIGLFDLTEMKVIKTPEYLYPDVELRASLRLYPTHRTS